MMTMQRRSKIREILLVQGAVKVAELVERFNVSEETIRRDLSELEREGIAHKNYGGAIVAEEVMRAMSSIPSVQQRKIENLKEKTAIAANAAGLVQDGQVILLDAGSTTWCLLQQIKKVEALTVITNSIDIAAECAEVEGWEVHMTGGRLIKRSMSLIGPNTEEALRNYNVDLCFLGASGVTLTRGFTSADIFEAQIKRTMVEVSSRVIVLADSHKFDSKGLDTFVNFSDVDQLYTTSCLQEEKLSLLKEKISEVVVCDC